jgi:transcriptional regulator of acetoin/glycerol metabolism
LSPPNRKQTPRLIQARTTSVHQLIVRVKLKQQVFARLGGCRLEIPALIERRWQFEIHDDRVRVIRD